MAEQHDLRSELGAAPIVRDVVRVQGPDAVEYLQGQLSQDVASLEVGASAPALLLQPAGKVDAWLRVTRLADDELLLDVDRGFGDAVLARLRRFLLRTKADLEPGTMGGLALRGPGARGVDTPPGAHALVAAWPGVEALDLLSEGEIALAGCPLASAAALEALRIECGVPAMGAELTDATIPAEAGQWLIDASVSFTKGCYTGQELVARIDSRGSQVPHPIRGLLLTGDDVPGAGAEVWVTGGDAAVGAITSAASSPALGVIALARLGRAVSPGADVELRTGDAVVARGTVAELPLR